MQDSHSIFSPRTWMKHRLPGERAEDYVQRLADSKARFVAQYVDRSDGRRRVVIGADTVVVAEARFSASRRTPKTPGGCFGCSAAGITTSYRPLVS